MFKTWREEYRASQALKRQIEQEQWEQEKQWREEDRAERKKVLAENSVSLELHNDNLRAATGVSYLTLVCHEDTWTFMARRAFGQWEPHWTQSAAPASIVNIPHSPGSTEAKQFKVNPNLPDGRIKKIADGLTRRGMQEVLLSGHNLVQILTALHEGTKEDDVALSARCGRLYDKFVEFVDLVDPEAEAGKTTGIRFHIDDSVDAAYVK
ncbi:hypothetical protein ACFC5T_40135 [Streptomyces sp. NPDC055961]|uniref:hypothetical protein n=1 Tax=Streptomyces sp. NPDC055961 TaxID=3345666 RepID=UPI0035E1DA39